MNIIRKEFPNQFSKSSSFIMRAFILFLGSMFLLLSCSTKPDQKEIMFYQRLVQDKIDQVNQSLMYIDRQINKYEIKQDTTILIESQNFVSKINLLLDSNKIRMACQEIYNELKRVDYEDIEEKYAAIDELFYMDSLYGIQKDTLMKLKYKNSIYNALNFVLISKSSNLHYNCGFSTPTQVMYNTNGYKLNDTLEMIVVPGSFIYMNTMMPRTDKFSGRLNISVDFKKYFLINNKTKDTIVIEMKPMKSILLLSAVIKERGDYTLKGSLVLSNDKRSFISITNKLIYIE